MIPGRTSLLLTLTIIVAVLGPYAAAERETLWVPTFNREFINWATPHIEEFGFPSADQYSQVLCHIVISCPSAPGDCDPWDRFGNLSVRDFDSDSTHIDYEIARFVTPYDITIPDGPYQCSWTVDVTDYQFMLHDEVTLVLFIDSWIGGDQGWLLTINFELVPGVPERVPFAIDRLWHFGSIVYGDPDNPAEDHLTPLDVTIPSEAIGTKFRAFSTGHGFWNTDNAAEFSYKWQQINVGEHSAQHYLWRDDCAENPCSPQGGTWTYNRAGWCPGDKADAWDVDISDWIAGGETSSLLFVLQPYENWCRPNNPDCVDATGCECAGHAYYRLQCQLVHYREPDLSAVDDRQPPAPRRLHALGSRPTPFGQQTTVSYRLLDAGSVTLTVWDVRGAQVQTVQREHVAPGIYDWSWNGRDAAAQPVAAGVYFCEIRYGKERVTERLMLVN